MTRRVAAQVHHAGRLPSPALLNEDDWAAFAHLVTLTVRGEGWASYSFTHPPGCTPREGGWCEFSDRVAARSARVLPKELGVHAATIEDGAPAFTYVRALMPEDHHG